MMLRNHYPGGVLSLCVLLVLVGCSTAPLQSVSSEQGEAHARQQAKQLVREGRLAFDEGRKHSAMESWQAAVNLAPEDAATVNNLALLYSEDKRFKDAISLLETGLAYSPDTAELHFNLAVISELYLLDLETALIHYRHYRELNGDGDTRVAGWIADLERRID